MPWKRHKGGYGKKGKKRGGHIKKPRTYAALRRKGYSKRKAARITNST